MTSDRTLRQVIRWTLAALFAAFAMLVGTGVWLILRYEPTVGVRVLDDQTRWILDWVTRVRSVHRFAAWLTVIAAVALLVEAAVDATWRRRLRIALPAIPVPAVAVLAMLTGTLLPYTAVVRGGRPAPADGSGYGVVFASGVRGLVVGRGTTTVTTLRRTFWTHTTVLPLLLLVLLVVTTVLVRRSRPALASPAGADTDVTGSEPWH